MIQVNSRANDFLIANNWHRHIWDLNNMYRIGFMNVGDFSNICFLKIFNASSHLSSLYFIMFFLYMIPSMVANRRRGDVYETTLRIPSEYIIIKLEIIYYHPQLWIKNKMIISSKPNGSKYPEEKRIEKETIFQME